MTKLSFKLIRLGSKVVPANVRQQLRVALRPFYKWLLPNAHYIVFHPTLRCNYRCPYCLVNTKIDYERKYPRTTEVDWPEWAKVFDHMDSSILFITGGEPFCYSGLPSLISGMSQKHVIAALSTNLSLRFDEFLQIPPSSIFNVSASFHPHMVDIGSFGKKVTTLRERGFQVSVGLVAYPEILNSIRELVTYFEKDIGVRCIVEPYSDPSYRYTDEERRIVDKYAPSGRKLGYDIDDNSPKQCNAGSRCFMIISNGDVYTCYAGFYHMTSPLHEKLSKEGNFFMGNLFDGTFRGLSKPMICRIPCSEACDIALSNVRPVKRL